MNKHGFIGVRKRTDGRKMPYYARFRFKGMVLYTRSYKTAIEAALEYEKYKVSAK